MTFSNIFKSKLKTALALGAVIAPLSMAMSVATAPAQADGMSKAEIEKIIENYLMENPTVIMQSVENYQRTGMAEQQQQALTKNHAALFKNDKTPVAGNPDGDITVVEFFDYNCGYCKRAVPGLQAVLKEDKNVKILFKEFPILGPSSMLGAQWALAAHQQDAEKYLSFHMALMESSGKLDEDKLTNIAKSVGLNVERLKQDAQSDEIAQTLIKNRELARSLNITGTPGFIIGDTIHPGALSTDQLKELIKMERENKS